MKIAAYQFGISGRIQENMEKTDLNIVLFYDVSDTDDRERYDLIAAHLKTRAVENVTAFISVNATSPYQTAPTCYIDASGKVISELKRGEEGMLICDHVKRELNFGELGRKRYSDGFVIGDGSRR